ncbi:MAG: thiolase domain-containing protein [Anaerolineae bacterium]|nr:MAG: thiolase domain-containing protein [Anaerolineae bacterium]
MREVAILGVGQTPVREHWEMSLRALAVEAGRAALADAGVDKVDAIYVSNMNSDRLVGQRHLGPLVADYLGQRGVEAVKLEAACGSAGSAMRQGMMAVASGELERVLIIGAEKLTETPHQETTAALATAADADFEVEQGITFVGLNALIMRRYMHQYGYTHKDFAPFAIAAHANAARNPNALYRYAIDEREYERGRDVADPIRLYDASPIGDGAAALLLVAADKAPSAVRVIGSASATDTVSVHDREDILWLNAAELSARRAYDQAKVGPADIDLFELHDAFSIMAALSLEACGFAERGRGVRVGLDGDITLGGRIPISTMGGLKARGHPVGATGLYQLVEATLQLRGQAGATQVPGARIAMTQNIGGSGATITTHILKA